MGCGDDAAGLVEDAERVHPALKARYLHLAIVVTAAGQAALAVEVKRQCRLPALVVHGRQCASRAGRQT